MREDAAVRVDALLPWKRRGAVRVRDAVTAPAASPATWAVLSRAEAGALLFLVGGLCPPASLRQGPREHEQAGQRETGLARSGAITSPTAAALSWDLAVVNHSAGRWLIGRSLHGRRLSGVRR